MALLVLDEATYCVAKACLAGGRIIDRGMTTPKRVDVLALGPIPAPWLAITWRSSLRGILLMTFGSKLANIGCHSPHLWLI